MGSEWTSLRGGGLKPSSEGKRVVMDGADRTVTDGPFAKASELVAGFWLWDVKTMDEAVAGTLSRSVIGVSPNA